MEKTTKNPAASSRVLKNHHKSRPLRLGPVFRLFLLILKDSQMLHFVDFWASGVQVSSSKTTKIPAASSRLMFFYDFYRFLKDSQMLHFVDFWASGVQVSFYVKCTELRSMHTNQFQALYFVVLLDFFCKTHGRPLT